MTVSFTLIALYVRGYPVTPLGDSLGLCMTRTGATDCPSARTKSLPSVFLRMSMATAFALASDPYFVLNASIVSQTLVSVRSVFVSPLLRSRFSVADRYTTGFAPISLTCETSTPVSVPCHVLCVFASGEWFSRESYRMMFFALVRYVFAKRRR